jgi:hypothetical protein
MSERDTKTTDHEARIAWLEAEVARLAAKVDASIHMTGHDTPTPKPAE